MPEIARGEVRSDWCSKALCRSNSEAVRKLVLPLSLRQSLVSETYGTLKDVDGQALMLVCDASSTPSSQASTLVLTLKMSALVAAAFDVCDPSSDEGEWSGSDSFAPDWGSPIPSPRGAIPETQASP